MDYVSDAAQASENKDKPDCNQAARSAVSSMIKMLARHGFEEREITLAIAGVVDDHILYLAKQ